jgi:hypothetical protein
MSRQIRGRTTMGMMVGVLAIVPLTVPGNAQAITSCNWTATPTTSLYLGDNQIQITGIESGSFAGMHNLLNLLLRGNPALTNLNLEAADFSEIVNQSKSGPKDRDRAAQGEALGIQTRHDVKP